MFHNVKISSKSFIFPLQDESWTSELLITELLKIELLITELSETELLTTEILTTNLKSSVVKKFSRYKVRCQLLNI